MLWATQLYTYVPKLSISPPNTETEDMGHSARIKLTDSVRFYCYIQNSSYGRLCWWWETIWHPQSIRVPKSSLLCVGNNLEIILCHCLSLIQEKWNDIFFMKRLSVRLYSDASWLRYKYLLMFADISMCTEVHSTQMEGT